VGGDFNIMRRKEDKNNGNFNSRWPFIFNAIIDSLDLRELGLSGRQYTWASRCQVPTFEKLDRILMSVDWEQKFPLASVQALPRSGSDHTPLLLDTGEQSNIGNKVEFSFELSWLKQEGFREIVEREWSLVPTVDNPIINWQNKIHHLRQYLRGWARELSGKYKIERDRLNFIIDSLDKKSETTILCDAEREALKIANDEIATLRRVEESKWAQRAKIKHIQEGGNNTKYFHLIANGKHRRKKIIQLEQEEGTIIGQENLKKYITKYYKSLFGAPATSNVSLVEDLNDDIPQLTQEENNILTAEFLEKEVLDAIEQMEKNKAPGPDGIPVEFYQTFWGLIKEDFMGMVKCFYTGELPLFLNFGTIILLLKKENAIQIQQYRPICLLNVSFKIFTKVATNRISIIADKVIRPTQTAFMPGRHILEGVVILHETIHELHRKKLDGVLLKLILKRQTIKLNGLFFNKLYA
jgi:hypothetical protein